MIKHFSKSIEKKIDKDNLNENKISAEITYKYDSEIQILNHMLKEIQNDCVKYEIEKVDLENELN